MRRGGACGAACAALDSAWNPVRCVALFVLAEATGATGTVCATATQYSTWVLPSQPCVGIALRKKPRDTRSTQSEDNVTEHGWAGLEPPSTVPAWCGAAVEATRGIFRSVAPPHSRTAALFAVRANPKPLRGRQT